MQLQLSLKIADRLHHDLLVRGRPLEASEAARVLLGAPAAPAVAVDVLEVLVRDDRRFCWATSPGELLTLRSWESEDPDVASVTFVALDLETTGAKAGTGKITEVGAVRIEGLRVVEEFQTLVNPQRPIPPIITHITGITQSMVMDAPRIEEVIPSLLEFIEGTVVVAHNAPFDVGFLNYELHRLRSRRLGEGAIDTLPLSRALVPGLVNYRLGTVAQALDAPVTACHRALADAQAVAHVFLRLTEVLQSREVTRLSEIRAHGRGSPPSQLGKLALTRDLPEGPGAYVFMGHDDRALLVGQADHLAQEVRSLFMPGPRRHRGMRTALGLVERIDHEESATSLEAAIREQQLILEHRPPYNPYWTAPEGYLYIRAAGGGSGLALMTTRRAPRWLRDHGVSSSPVHGELVIGPFRRRSSAQAAVTLLQRCFPIRHCPRQSGTRPCSRGALGLCLCPCIADESTVAQHDGLVTDLVRWLAGQPTGKLLDPEQRADEMARELSQKRLHEEARSARGDVEHLLVVRRAYEALATARALDFVYLKRTEGADGLPAVRLNLVLGGGLAMATSLDRCVSAQRIREAMEHARGAMLSAPKDQHRALVAVPQEELDSLLAVGRWVQQGPHAEDVLVRIPDSSPRSLDRVRVQVETECQSLLVR
jgi:DNA polymerase-3 subunit epsilon